MPKTETEPWRGTDLSVNELRRNAVKRNESMEGGTAWRALDFLLYLVMVVLIMFSIRTVLLDPVRVDGKSMLDTLEDGDVMLVDRTAYMFKTPQRGDIVMCYYPDSYYEIQEIPYASRVKRVVAVAGDTIETIDGVLCVNGEPVDEPYLTQDRCVYVLGDNRSVSRDSRYDTVGPIPLCRVVGKARLVLFPVKKLHLV